MPLSSLRCAYIACTNAYGVVNRFQNDFAIYFSRGVIPHNKKGEVGDFPAPFKGKPYMLHLGLQCYDRDFLKIYGKLPATPLMVSGA